MMRRGLLLSISFISLLLAGCASLSQEQCEHGDWFSIGQGDGNSGKWASRIAKHNHACEEYGIEINRAEYMRGWNDGIRNYCTAASGFSLGKRGEEYNRVCPAGLELDFVTGYREGVEILLREKQWEYDANERELYRYSRQQARARSEDERVELKKEIAEHEEKHARLEQEILQLMKHIAMARERELTLR